MASGPVKPIASEQGAWEADPAPPPETERASAPAGDASHEGDSQPEIDLAQFAGAARAEPWRLRHLMYLVAVSAVMIWFGMLVTDKFILVSLLVLAGLVMTFVSLMGAGIVRARRRSTRQDAILWVLAIAAERNMPLAPAVAAFAGQYRGLMYRRVMGLAAHLSWGTMLPEALTRARTVVSRDAVLLAWVGAVSGLLPKALRMAANSRSTQLPIWTAIASRLSYILVILLVMQTITSFMLYFTIPKFEAIFNDFGQQLPPITMAIISGSQYIVRYGSPLLLLPFVEIGLLVFIPFTFLAWGDYRVPIFDRLFRRRHTALILRSLSLVVEGNKPVSLGLSALATHYPTLWVRWKLIRADREVRQGVDWIEALRRQGLIRAADALVLASAMAVGNLAWALSELADTAERRLATRFQAFIQTLFPFVVIMLGIVIFIIALGYFLPLVQLIGRLTDLS